MKKFILCAAILIAGITSAKALTPAEEYDAKLQEKTEAIVESKAEALVDSNCFVFHASCTSASTCQDWSVEQWYEWAVEIQNNYCELGGPYAH